MSISFNLGEDPEQLLQQASAAARAMLENQQNRKAELEAELEKIGNTIMRLNQLVAAGSTPDDASTASGSVVMRRRTPPWARASAAISAAVAEPISAEEKARAEATALSDMEQVMGLVDTPLSVGDLKSHIHIMLGRTWAESTLYNHLGRGKAEGRYAHENNRWSLIKGETE